MSRIEKRLEKMEGNPKNVSFDDLKVVLEYFGFELKSKKGSHYTVTHPTYKIFDIKTPNVIPRNRPHVLEVYVKHALDWINKVKDYEKND